MLKFAYFRVFLITFGLLQGPLRSRTSHNMIFGMSFDGLMTSARKRNGSKKSQSLGSEIMCHPTLKVKKTHFIIGSDVSVPKKTLHSKIGLHDQTIWKCVLES